MDLRLFVAVLRRFKKLTIGGLIAAVVLAGLAYARGGGAPTWQAQSEVLITQANDPYGGATPEVVQEGGYLGSLSNVYAAMANGDAVQVMVQRAAGVPNGVVSAAEVVDPATGNPEPLITLTSSAGTSSGAVGLAQKMPAVLEKYIVGQQALASVPAGQRVQLAAVKNGFPPEMLSSKSKTVLPVLVFMGVLIAVITIAFMLENINPKTAAKLGRETAPKYVAAAGGELAAVLAALVHNQQSMSAPSEASPGRVVDDSTPPANGHGGGQVPSSAQWETALERRRHVHKDPLRERGDAVATNGHSSDESEREHGDPEAAVVKRLLRGRS